MLSFFITLISLVLPSPGRIYEKKINLPLIGYQNIETEIITDNVAFVKLDGLINKNGTVRYLYRNDKHYIRFSNSLKEIIKTYNIELNKPYYDEEYDQIVFDLIVNIIRYKTNIIMTRLN